MASLTPDDPCSKVWQALWDLPDCDVRREQQPAGSTVVGDRGLGSDRRGCQPLPCQLPALLMHSSTYQLLTKGYQVPTV